MQIAKPQVHLKKQNDPTVYHIHVVTWMDQTKYTSDGHNTVPTSATDGVFSVVIKIKEDSTVPNMHLLTPVVHTLTLTDLEFDEMAPFLDVTVINTSDSNAVLGKRRTHQDDADDSGMPEPPPKRIAHAHLK